MSKESFYITTAIDYVNAAPHIGHAFEKCVADAIARWNRLQDKNVFFLTGVDENAQKNVEAAEKAGVSVKEFVDTNTQLFITLCDGLNTSYDDFVRTTADQHKKVVLEIIQKIIDKGDIYKGEYSGLYCVGCETYYTEKDLVNGKCPEHEKAPELRKEEGYFFKLSAYKDTLLEIVPEYVTPKSRRNEIIARLKGDVKDVFISRKGADWGIGFPGDEDFKIWVWFDALINYVSGLGDKREFWPANVHVIGKGINWFHSVIWPAMLLAADMPLPKKLLVHGYLNVGGKKMSKSLGNTIDPLELLKKYDTDSIRYSLLRCSVFDDSDYSEELLIARHNSELADKLGNLVSRVSALAEKYGLEETECSLSSDKTLEAVTKHFESFELDKALHEIFAFIDRANEHIQHSKPWEVSSPQRIDDFGGDLSKSESHSRKVLFDLTNAIKDAAILLSPFLPETAEKIAKVFGFDISLDTLKKPLVVTEIKKAAPLFAKL